MNHGAPDALEHHEGDLGNLLADDNGVATIDIFGSSVQLLGPDSALNRAFVVHALEDDLGLFPHNATSLANGNSGARLACAIILQTTQ